MSKNVQYANQEKPTTSPSISAYESETKGLKMIKYCVFYDNF